MELAELRTKTVKDLERILRDTQKELHEKKMAHATGQLKQHTDLRNLKKSVAQIKTVMRDAQTSK